MEKENKKKSVVWSISFQNVSSKKPKNNISVILPYLEKLYEKFLFKNGRGLSSSQILKGKQKILKDTSGDI